MVVAESPNNDSLSQGPFSQRVALQSKIFSAGKLPVFIFIRNISKRTRNDSRQKSSLMFAKNISYKVVISIVLP